jgi:hypothetical protein
VPYVRPGGESLLRISWWPRVEKVLQVIDAIEALGIDPADAAPDHWQQIHDRLSVGERPPGNTCHHGGRRQMNLHAGGNDQHLAFSSRSKTYRRTSSGSLPAVSKFDRDRTGRSWQDILQDYGLGTCITVAAALLIGDPHRNQIGCLALAEAELGAPSEQHTGDDPVRADSRGGSPVAAGKKF